ncbi:MAG: flavodoxin domain-containing protein [Betaproteobacteria bacterium]
MKKILKIIAVVFIVVIIAVFGFFSLIVLDVAGSFATDVHPLPNGAPIGQAIVVYNPGLSGAAKDIATKIGYELQEGGYNVVLAGVKSNAAADLSGYDLIVVGGPIYAGKPSNSIQTYLNSLNPPADAKVGVFGYGNAAIDNSNQTLVNQDVANLPAKSTLTLTAAIKIINTDDIDSKCEEFVSRFG